MSHTPHELAEAFPEHVELMRRLKTEDAHYSRLADEHHELNREIHRAETNVEPMSDMHMEELRKKRLRLLDEISAILRAAAG